MFGDNSAFPWQQSPVVFPLEKKTRLVALLQLGAAQILDPFRS